MINNWKERLGWAAKAMRATSHTHFCNYDVVDENSVCLQLGATRGAITSYWHPRTQGQDAMQIMTTLRFLVQVRDTVTFVCDQDGTQLSFCAHKPYNGNAHLATCHAIVCAAAHIGKSLP